MARDTKSWPYWPWPPVNCSGAPEEGRGLIHWDGVTSRITVYRATPETGAELTTGHLIVADDLDVLEEYDSVESLIAAGWTG